MLVLKSKSCITSNNKSNKNFCKYCRDIKLISQNIALFERFERIENRLTIHDKNFNLLFKALEDKNNIPVQNIFLMVKFMMLTVL